MATTIDFGKFDPNKRIPIRCLSYADKEKAMPMELMVDYSNGALYIVNEDGTRIFNLTNAIVEIIEKNGFDIYDLTITIPGQGVFKVGDILIQLLENEIQFINSENEKYAGVSFAYDTLSIVIKNKIIQLNGFDTAQDGYIPQKSGGILRWIPEPSGGSGSGNNPDEADVIIIEPDDEYKIQLLSTGKQMTILNVEDKFTLQMPTVGKQYTKIEWLFNVGNIAPTINIPSNMKFKQDKDKEVVSETITKYTFTTWDQGNTWLADIDRYGVISDTDYVTKGYLDDNYFTKQEVVDRISWEINK